MKITIQTPGFNAKQELTGFIHEKLEKLGLFNDEVVSTEVCLKLDNSSTKGNKLCDIRLVIPGNDMLASARCKTFEEATVQAIDAAAKQINSKKKRIIGRRNDISPKNILV